MRYAVGVWNFRHAAASLPELVSVFADMGFDAVSLLPREVLDLGASERGALLAVVEARGLGVTVHGNFDLTPGDAGRLMETLGPRLLALTMDAAKAKGEAGPRFDTARMGALLSEIERLSRGTDLRFGVEDFPLDAATLEAARAHLGPVADCPRFGLLVDLGHMNLRRREAGPYEGLSMAAYLAGPPVPIVEVHVHDNDGTRDQHAPLGAGNLDFAEAARALADLGFDGVSTVEIAPDLHGADRAGSVRLAGQALETWRGFWQNRAP